MRLLAMSCLLPACMSGPPAGPHVLATPPADDETTAIGVAGDQVYFALYFAGLQAVSTAGGPVMPVASTATYLHSHSFTADASNMYWAQNFLGHKDGVIARVSLHGGDATVLATSTGFIAGIAVDQAAVYWVDQDAGTIDRVPIAGGTSAVVASGLAMPGGLALHAGTLYTMTAGGDVLGVSVSGGAVTTLVTGPGLPPIVSEVAYWVPGIAVDDDNVYYSYCPFDGGASSVDRVARTGGASLHLADSCVTGIAVDATDVYWVAGTGVGSVNRAPIAGGEIAVLGDHETGAVGPALDDHAVYWATTVLVPAQCGLCPPSQPTGSNAIKMLPKD